jgi:hypothetical protein
MMGRNHIKSEDHSKTSSISWPNMKITSQLWLAFISFTLWDMKHIPQVTSKGILFDGGVRLGLEHRSSRNCARGHLSKIPTPYDSILVEVIKWPKTMAILRCGAPNVRETAAGRENIAKFANSRQYNNYLFCDLLPKPFLLNKMNVSLKS